MEMLWTNTDHFRAAFFLWRRPEGVHFFTGMQNEQLQRVEVFQSTPNTLEQNSLTGAMSRSPLTVIYCPFIVQEEWLASIVD
jgi:hypothetical protein